MNNMYAVCEWFDNHDVPVFHTSDVRVVRVFSTKDKAVEFMKGLVMDIVKGWYDDGAIEYDDFFDDDNEGDGRKFIDWYANVYDSFSEDGCLWKDNSCQVWIAPTTIGD